jgi:hypothetical protein
LKQASVVSVIQVVVFLSVFPFQKADAVSVSKNADTRSGELDEVFLALLASLRLSEFGYPCMLEPALHFQFLEFDRLSMRLSKSASDRSRLFRLGQSAQLTSSK